MATSTLVQAHLLECPECGTPIDSAQVNTDHDLQCPCGQALRIWAFPAALRAPQSAPPPHPAGDEDATCFFHPHSQATESCGHCGRYVCPVCDVAFDGGHLCPECLGSARKNREIEALKARYPNLDRRALALAILPTFISVVLVGLLIPTVDETTGLLEMVAFVFFFVHVFPGLFTAPAAFSMGLRAWKIWEPNPFSPTRTRIRLALLISAAHCLILVGFSIVAIVFSILGWSS